MNRIEKFLRGLRGKEREAILLLMTQLKKDFRQIPHIKSLAGKQNWYRVRMGEYRIIFAIENGIVEIKKITKRDEQTYQNLN